jgi:adenylate cyclase
MTTHSDSDGETESIWRFALTETHYGRFSRLPATRRCAVCSTPFSGIGGRMAQLVGLHPSSMNPHICNYCDELLPPGGAEIDTVLLFADVRGSTSIAEGMSAREYTTLINRFYECTTSVLIRHRAVIDKLIGDEVMAFFLPANDTDPDRKGYRRHAVAAAVEILHAAGYRPGVEPWIPLAIGIQAGEAFVGKVGSEGVYSFTALGDTVNTAARLRSEAAAGEILLGADIYGTVETTYPGLGSREVVVKGKSQPLRVFSLRPAETRAATANVT